MATGSGKPKDALFVGGPYDGRTFTVYEGQPAVSTRTSNPDNTGFITAVYKLDRLDGLYHYVDPTDPDTSNPNLTNPTWKTT